MSTLNVGTLNTTTGVKLPVYTSGSRPSGAITGQLIFNSSKNLVEFWDGTIWSNFEFGSVTASGGTTNDSGGYRIHTFTGNGTFSVSAASSNAKVEYLIVAGGGAGALSNGGGGGGGGVVHGWSPVAAQSYAITVGGGAGGPGDRFPMGSAIPRQQPYPSGIRGANSSAFGITAIGGGNGGGDDSYGSDGGSGGGGSDDGQYAGSGRAIQGQIDGSWGAGNKGGDGNVGGNNEAGAGGGGAGEPGWDNYTYITSTYQRKGGDGLAFNTSGTMTYYGGGGGGAKKTSGTSTGNGGTAGLGGGGTGGDTNAYGTSGSPNTGGGGGGSSPGTGGAGNGSGGSGIVIIRYRI